MADSHFRLVGRGLGALVAASLLAGVSLDAAAYGSKGTIFLQTGKTLTNFNFSYEGETDSEPQDFAFIKGCTVQLDPGDPALVSLNALRGGNAGVLGFIATSIGVHDGPQGTACGRVSQAKAEALELVLGTDIPDGGNAFDRLELDLELKGDVVLKLDITFDARVVTYYLEAGAGRAPVVADPAKVTRCSISSDSGPDSGPSDNCRWMVDELGKSFKITPLAGEFSLEGGGDFADVATNRTAIFLTEADGIFDCGDTAAASDPTISCSVTRLDPGGTAQCVPVPYVFRAGGGSCELTVDPNGQQIVANLLVSYDPEPAPGNLLTINSTYENWPNVPLSRVWFANDPSNTSYPIPPCLGATIDDGFTGPLPIPEIQNGDSTDWVVGNDTIEFACAFQRTEILETDPGSNSLKRYIEEGIQFWGDIKFERF